MSPEAYLRRDTGCTVIVTIGYHCWTKHFSDEAIAVSESKEMGLEVQNEKWVNDGLFVEVPETFSETTLVEQGFSCHQIDGPHIQRV